MLGLWEGFELAVSAIYLRPQLVYFTASLLSWTLMLAWKTSAYPRLDIAPGFRSVWLLIKQERIMVGFVFFLMILNDPFFAGLLLIVSGTKQVLNALRNTDTKI